MSARELLAGGGSVLVGDMRQSFAGDAYMLSKGYYPLTGGVLNQADNPVLFNAIRHKWYYLNNVNGAYWQFQDTSGQSPLIDFDGDDIAVAIGTGNSSFYSNVIRVSNGARLRNDYITGGGSNYAPKVVRFTGSAFYIGFYNGDLYRLSGQNYLTRERMYGGTFPFNSYPEIQDIIEANGFVYVATGEGIWRAALSGNLTGSGAWTKVSAVSLMYLYNSTGETHKGNFYYDAVSGNLFYNMDKGVTLRSVNNGLTWVDMGNYPNKSRIFRWGSALYMIDRDTQTSNSTGVIKSTDGGLSWTTSPMRLAATSKFMQPIVKNGILYYNYAGAVRMLFSEQPGLQEPNKDPRYTNAVELVGMSGSLGFPANDNIGFRSIVPVIDRDPNTILGSRSFTPAYDFATQFRLPTVTGDIPLYMKGG